MKKMVSKILMSMAALIMLLMSAVPHHHHCSSPAMAHHIDYICFDGSDCCNCQADCCGSDHHHCGNKSKEKQILVPDKLSYQYRVRTKGLRAPPVA